MCVCVCACVCVCEIKKIKKSTDGTLIIRISIVFAKESDEKTSLVLLQYTRTSDPGTLVTILAVPGSDLRLMAFFECKSPFYRPGSPIKPWRVLQPSLFDNHWFECVLKSAH